MTCPQAIYIASVVEATLFPTMRSGTSSPTPASLICTGVFRVCLDTQGAVVSAYLLKTTGFGGYDQQIVHAMRSKWHCRPFIKNGVPEPGCTTASIHYGQRAPRRGGCLAPRWPR